MKANGICIKRHRTKRGFGFTIHQTNCPQRLPAGSECIPGGVRIAAGVNLGWLINNLHGLAILAATTQTETGLAFARFFNEAYRARQARKLTLNQATPSYKAWFKKQSKEVRDAEKQLRWS